MSTTNDPHVRTEVRDGMRITWHQPIRMDDGLVLRADVYRPIEELRCPVILTYGVYAKGLAYQDGYPLQWEKMVDRLSGDPAQVSTNKYQNWETTDPERWVPHGYAVVRVDSRGAGWSPGFMDPGRPREIEDLYQCIEWAGTQPWSNGKVGMLGISYYASNQWRVAGMHPPHLAAIIPWEGQNDRYRDSGYHGGILSQFQERWAKHQVANIQYGRGERAKKNPNHRRIGCRSGDVVRRGACANRVDAFEELKKHPLDDSMASLALGRSVARAHAAAHVRQLGRAGDSSARQLQRLHRDAGVHTEVAGGARGFALVAVLERLRRRSAEALLRLLPQGRRRTAGSGSRACS